MLAALIFSVFATVLSAATSSVSAAASSLADPDVGLQRGGFFGARVVPVPNEIRDRFKLEAGRGVSIAEVITDSTAEAAGFKAGDVLLALNGTKIAGPGAFTQAIAGRKAGAELTIELRRGEDLRRETVTLKGRPLEKSDAFDVVYGAVASRAGQLRTIVTRPKGAGKRPALFFIQGIGLASIDNPVGGLSAYKTIVDDFTRHGFVTLRVDKPGCGDSEGGPARDIDFDTELDGYRQALEMLKARDDVDADRVFIFGHSMGGVMAPLLAANVPVRGIIVYGTIARTWTEYWLENVRRQMELAGALPSAIDRDLRAEAALSTHLYTENQSPQEIIKHSPQLREQLEQSVTEDRYFFDRSLTFYRQLAGKNLGAAWESFGGHALAIWGKGDYVSNEDDHGLIARMVNQVHPGRGTFLALDDIDHGFNRADSRRTSSNAAGLGSRVSSTRRSSKSPSPGSRKRLMTPLVPPWNAIHRAGPTSWPRPAPSSRGGLAGRCQRKPSWGLFRNGRWTRRAGRWYVRATGAMSGCAGTRNWVTSSITSNGDSRQLRARKATTRAFMLAIRPTDESITRHRPATRRADTCSATRSARRAPKRFDLSKQQTASRVKPAGQWNTFEITCRGPEMTLWVNGALTNQWHDCEVKKGHVGLEAEGWRIEFRNVKLKPLGDAKPEETERKS